MKISFLSRQFLSYAMNRRRCLCLHTKEFFQNSTQCLWRFPNHNIHFLLLSNDGSRHIRMQLTGMPPETEVPQREKSPQSKSPRPMPLQKSQESRIHSDYFETCASPPLFCSSIYKAPCPSSKKYPSRFRLGHLSHFLLSCQSFNGFNSS